MSEQLANLASSTLSVNYVAGSLSMTLVSAAAFPTLGTFTVTLVDPVTGSVKMLFRVTSVAGNVLTGAVEAATGFPDVNCAAGTVVVGTMMTKAAIQQIETDINTNFLAQLGVGLSSLTDPNGFSFTWFNQASSTVTTNGPTIRQFTPNSSGNNLSGRKTTIAGGSPYTLTLGYVPNVASQNFSQCGICITDGTDFRLIRYRGENSSIEVWSWTGTGTPATNFANIGGSGAIVGNIRFFRIRETLTTRFYEYSSDGVVFHIAFSELAGAGITANAGGWFCLGNGFDAAITVVSLTLTAP